MLTEWKRVDDPIGVIPISGGAAWRVADVMRPIAAVSESIDDQQTWILL